MKTRVGLIVLLVVFSVLGPTLETSEGGGLGARGKDVVLYELNEQAQFTAANHRMATSGLEGKARRGTPLCTERLMAHAEVVLAQLHIIVHDASRCSRTSVRWEAPPCALRSRSSTTNAGGE